MPTNYRNVFATNDMIVHYRLRKDGVYEARFHRQGIGIDTQVARNFCLSEYKKARLIVQKSLKMNEKPRFWLGRSDS